MNYTPVYDEDMHGRPVPHLVGLVRGEPHGKRRANGMDVIPAGSSHIWDAMCADAGAYRVRGKTKNGRPLENSLRHDAVIGFALIFPYMESLMYDWDSRDHYRFLDTALEALHNMHSKDKKAPAVFRDIFRDENIRLKSPVFLNAEGNGYLDMLVVGDAKDRNGHYCGNMINWLMKESIKNGFWLHMSCQGINYENLSQHAYMCKLENMRAGIDEKRVWRMRQEEMGRKGS